MVAGITVREDGFAEAAFSLEPAWHGLGTVFDHVMYSKEAFEAAGLNWNVVQKAVGVGDRRRVELPLTINDPSPSGEYREEIIWTEQPNYRANIREDNGAFMGIVTDQYKVVQNTEAFQFLDALVENHEMEYESAFSLYGGRKVVVLARMPGVWEIVPGDAILPYILLSLSHDGSEGIRFGPVATRVVCSNTYAMAVGEGTTREMSIRHTGNIQDKLGRARNLLGVANAQFAQYAEIGRRLAECQLSIQDWKDYLNIMCPELDPRDPDYTDRRAEQILETRISIMGCFRNERNTLDGMKRTLWAAYNAVTEHIDHLPRRGATRERKAEARFNVCLYGAGRDMKKRALQTACRFAGLTLSV